jgi:hypothetical protein
MTVYDSLKFRVSYILILFDLSELINLNLKWELGKQGLILNDILIHFMIFFHVILKLNTFYVYLWYNQFLCFLLFNYGTIRFNTFWCSFLVKKKKKMFNTFWCSSVIQLSWSPDVLFMEQWSSTPGVLLWYNEV